MGLKSDIEDKVQTIVDDEFKADKVSYVPEINNSKLTFGNIGLQFDATVLYIDMRGSTKVLNSHNKTTVGKIHMAYFHAIVKVAASLGGEARSFNGDSMLVFFQGATRDMISTAVKAALQMKWGLENIVNPKLKGYSPIDFGIGIDYGTILCTKIGIKSTSNSVASTKQDLIWIGNPVNKAAKLGDKAKLPDAISISKMVYDHLNNEVKLHKSKDMWTKGGFTYDDSSKHYYYTHFGWTVS